MRVGDEGNTNSTITATLQFRDLSDRPLRAATCTFHQDHVTKHRYSRFLGARRYGSVLGLSRRLVRYSLLQMSQNTLNFFSHRPRCFARSMTMGFFESGCHSSSASGSMSAKETGFVIKKFAGQMIRSFKSEPT